MRILLNGGGSGGQAAAAVGKFSSLLDRPKPILYIPLAMEPKEYPSCYQWVTSELQSCGADIEMAVSGKDLAARDLSSYSGIFIGGGNTYRLLWELKRHGCIGRFQDFLERDGVVFGGSAGAIIFGETIDTCRYADENEVGLEDTRGFNVMDGISLLCHYTNEGEAVTRKHTDHLLRLSLGKKIIALPEEDTLFVNGGSMELIGKRPYYVFQNGIRQEVEP